jgi:hypothetical protein
LLVTNLPVRTVGSRSGEGKPWRTNASFSASNSDRLVCITDLLVSFTYTSVFLAYRTACITYRRARTTSRAACQLRGEPTSGLRAMTVVIKPISGAAHRVILEARTAFQPTRLGGAVGAIQILGAAFTRSGPVRPGDRPVRVIQRPKQARTKSTPLANGPHSGPIFEEISQVRGKQSCGLMIIRQRTN